MGLFKNFVEVGRLCVVSYGELKGKAVFIVDILDANRVLIDGPTTGVTRQVINLKRLNLTEFKIAIPRATREKTIKKQIEKSGVMKKWEASHWATRLAIVAKRAQLTDFERFKIRIARRKRSDFVHKKLKELRKEAKAAKPAAKQAAKPAAAKAK
eukprot:TRINITY_DN17785_c0_g2_i1.p2 TRINITY_DN17785_c0_g2~~TRINITY_DN17785_c0_g2_i1.p2  ORF type:complete len:166 (+),score=54.11 TRINITY_DN17785_c0_g2_i1:35-499(+)